MGRDANIENVHTREIYDIIDGSAITLDNGVALAAGDYIHDGAITFDNAFLESNESFLKIEKIILREHVGSGETLAKANLRIYIFDTIGDSATIVKNADFDFADLDGADLDNLKAVITVATADWQDVKSGAVTEDAIVEIDVIKCILKAATDLRTFKTVTIVDSGTPTWDTNATLKMSAAVTGG